MDDKSKPLASQVETPSEPPPSYTATSEHQPASSSSANLPSRPRAPSLRKGPPPLLPFELPIIKYMRSHRCILASASPRRRTLLSQVGLGHLEVLPSGKPENLPKDAMDPFAYVSATAAQKALDVYATAIRAVEAHQASGGSSSSSTPARDAAGGGEDEALDPRKWSPEKGDPDLVVAADTVIVTRDGAVLEKPGSEAQHKRMLRHLRDTRVHRVLTAVCAVAPKADASHPGYEMASHVEETKVWFAREADGLPDDVIDAYVKTREGVDKAGGYAVQGIGGMVLVEKVEGSVDNVVGLPVRKTLQLCEKVVFRQGEEEEDKSDEEE